ncbi:HAD family hydrolase (plasmid) [Halarchaeum sp. CBA1220]|uniref:HAD family hydrolase n=1 Tax=Halarchaeum sp. CBA1220 TaxID=1853682 RepID=UPI000F3A858C|nr:HAD family hydrolase [Halarchaeum sp. CBA1220]QLC35004.1 HAD family hydrolase [Halarchaeum sp. CBA1220]
MTYDTVVFDNDGVLVGRTRFDVLRDATAETFAQFGVTDPDTEHVEDMAVGATPERVDDVCTVYDLDPETFWRTRDRTLSAAQRVEAREGRKTPYEDIDTLADLDADLGVVSSNQQETVDFLVEHFGLDAFVDTAYGREETIESLDRRKPNPHYVERALADLDADSALFVGDNESDIEAAENAGIDSAFIRRPHRDRWELNVWPTWDIDSLEDLHDICAP